MGVPSALPSICWGYLCLHPLPLLQTLPLWHKRADRHRARLICTTGRGCSVLKAKYLPWPISKKTPAVRSKMCAFRHGFVVSPEHHGAVYPPLWHVPPLNNIWTQLYCWSHSFTVGIFHSVHCLVCLSLCRYKEFTLKNELCVCVWLCVLCFSVLYKNCKAMKRHQSFLKQVGHFIQS